MKNQALVLSLAILLFTCGCVEQQQGGSEKAPAAKKVPIAAKQVETSAPAPQLAWFVSRRRTDPTSWCQGCNFEWPEESSGVGAMGAADY